MLEKRERVARARVLAEDDDTDLRVRLAQPLGGLNPLVRASRRHADVGDDDVRPLRIHRGQQRVEVATDSGNLQIRPRLEQAPDAFADEVVILCKHDADRHGEKNTPVEPLVLIVDDNEQNLKLASDVLRTAGLRTLEAATGAEGIALASRAAARCDCYSTFT